MKVLSFSLLYDNVKGINEIISYRIALLKRQTRGLIGYRREGISVELKLLLRRVARKNLINLKDFLNYFSREFTEKFHSLYFEYNCEALTGFL